MIESSMYFGIGLLFGALIGLVLLPLIHARAVRLTTRRLEAVLPESMAEVQAEKDLLRAEFAMSTRRLEMTVEQLVNKTTSQVVELSKKTTSLINSRSSATRRKSRSSRSRPKSTRLSNRAQEPGGQPLDLTLPGNNSKQLAEREKAAYAVNFRDSLAVLVWYSIAIRRSWCQNSGSTPSCQIVLRAFPDNDPHPAGLGKAVRALKAHDHTWPRGSSGTKSPRSWESAR